MPRRARDRLGHAIIELIVAERLDAGYQFPPRLVLHREWDIGANTIGEGFNVAGDAGFVVVTQGDGTQVLPRDQWDLMHPLVIDHAHRSSPRPIELVAGYFEVERMFEVGELDQREPPHAELLQRLLATYEVMARAVRARGSDGEPGPEYYQADTDFHALIVAIGGNLVVAELSRLLRRAMAYEAQLRVYTPEDLKLDVAEHQAILGALAARDMAQAQELLRHHLTAAAARLAQRERRPTYRGTEEVDRLFAALRRLDDL